MKIFHTIIQNAAFRLRIVPLIIVLTLLSSLLIIAATPPATGYELSVYEAYPAFLWVVISINIFCCVYTILQSCDNPSKNLYYGYFSILLIETIILFFPLIRGYYSMSRGSGDIYYHLSVAGQISNSGYFPPDDSYPMMHILPSVLHLSLLDWQILSLLLSIIFFILYVGYLYILGKALLGGKKGGIYVSIFGIPLIFSYAHYAFYPLLFALYTIPLILYLYQKIPLAAQQQTGFYICLVFLSLFIVFCHPLITIFLLIMFFTFVLYELIKRWNAGLRRSKIVALNIAAIVVVTFSFWFVHFRSLLNTTKKISSALLGQEKVATIIDYQINVVQTSEASIWLILDRFIKVYGPMSLYFMISFLFLLYMIKQYYQYKKIYDPDLIYALQFIVAIIIGIMMITKFFVIFEPIRAASYAIIIATIICGLFFYRIRYSLIPEKQIMRFILSVTAITTIICMLTILTLYPSPWISHTNTALSYEDKNGIDWILENQNAEIPIVKEDERAIKYSWYYYEITNLKNNQNSIEYIWSIPSNFGYNKKRNIGNVFVDLPDKKVYMITTELMKLVPYSVPIERRNLIKWFNDADFIRLKNDSTVNLVYSTNQFKIWSIDIPKS